jgi:hypothetical protein
MPIEKLFVATRYPEEVACRIEFEKLDEPTVIAQVTGKSLAGEYITFLLPPVHGVFDSSNLRVPGQGVANPRRAAPRRTYNEDWNRFGTRRISSHTMNS